MEQNQASAESEAPVISWSVTDTWIGVGLLVLVSVVLILLVVFGNARDIFQSALLVVVEGVYLLPVVIILLWRRAPWSTLGFHLFDGKTMGIGCGLMLLAYGFSIVHNLILYALGVNTQGEQILEVFENLDSPLWFFFVVVIAAPVVEEIFFRGFLLQGFRQHYGAAKAILLSSFIFAAAHLDPVAFLPTFALGTVMAYTYHRSNSLFPGIILHILVNGFAACLAYVATQLPGIIPT